ncbi:MAG: SDR family oxidoreductase [Actinobacteria bacterium]|nr:SDR family oxidoreductase [Actinomycetota bacterium]
MSKYLESQFSLTGSRALVTGASKGIGAQIAIALASAGADLVLLGRSSESLADTKSQVVALGRNLSELICDLSDPKSVAALIPKLANESVDILVNNAGIITRADAVDASLEDWNLVFQTNLTSLFQISQVVAKKMLAKGAGRIINIASLLSFQGGIRVTGYAASKHAVAGLTKALANEWGAAGITVNAIAPGYIITDNTELLRKDADRSAGILARIPMGRWGTPEDIAGVAVFLAAPAARYINGEILTVDGGWLAR